MKIRKDFVTNSSSVSYIVTMNEEIAEVFKKYYDLAGKNLLVYNKLKDWAKSGQKIKLLGKDIYATEINFSTDECLDNDSLKKDFSEWTDEELISYIYGEYLVKGNMPSGFGATQTKTY